MLITYKSDYEKITMGLLSYLPDFRNLDNLKEEMHLNQVTPDFQLYLYQTGDDNKVGVVGVQVTEGFLVIRYLSLAPGYRDDHQRQIVVTELMHEYPKRRVSALPEYSYLLKFATK
ncbi:MAG: reductase [Lactobacillus sp.]|nr:reductase [Lactobacillus sp.]MDN6042613.1 reductase [Lactobacillus sp.]MDN6052329.1 reductase [Lactobacillus sp.]